MLIYGLGVSCTQNWVAATARAPAATAEARDMAPLVSSSAAFLVIPLRVKEMNG